MTSKWDKPKRCSSASNLVLKYLCKKGGALEPLTNTKDRRLPSSSHIVFSKFPVFTAVSLITYS